MKFSWQLSPLLNYNNFFQSKVKSIWVGSFPLLRIPWFESIVSISPKRIENTEEHSVRKQKTFNKKNNRTTKLFTKTWIKNDYLENTLRYIKIYYRVHCRNRLTFNVRLSSQKHNCAPILTSQHQSLFWRNLTKDFKPMVFNFIIIATLFSCLVLEAQYLPLNFSI